VSIADKLPAQLRKAAILISTLDTASADKLLDQMPPEQAALVRRAIMELEEIHSTEQDTVIREFLHSRQPYAAAMDTGVELDPSLLRKLNTKSSENNESDLSDPDASPFRFLHEAATDSLGRLLQREHPQIAAVVISHLPPEKAANILMLFTADLQAAVLRRVADLDSADPEVLRDLESELHSLLADQLPTGMVRSTGLTAVQAILKAADSRDRKDILENLEQRDGDLATRLHRGMPAHHSLVTNSTLPATADHRPASNHKFNPSAAHPTNVKTEMAEVKPPSSPISASFDDVTQLNSGDLARLFHRCDPQVTLLAITGAEEGFVERLFAQLPQRDAKLLRRRMQQLGPILLRDVERAQQRLAEVAARLASEGVIQMATRGFAAAA
jgi:flagellar motor switch protein FliG